MSPRVSHNAPALLVLGFLSLVACGGGDGSGASGSTNPPGGNGSGPGSATLSWLPPTENVDGSSVAGLAGYHVYSGTSQNSMRLVRSIPSPGITVVVIDGLTAGTHHFAVSAFTVLGAESELSSVGSKTVR